MTAPLSGYKELEEKYDSGRYKVHVECNSCKVCVVALREHSFFVGHVETVYPPSWIERLFGITFESKLQRAKAKTQRKCDKLNKYLDQCQEFCKQIKENRT